MSPQTSAGTSRIERGVLCAATGLGLLQYVAFGLGASGHLTPSAVKISLLALTVLLLPDMVRVCRALLRALQQSRQNLSWPAVVGVLLIAFVPFLQALAPCTDADGMGYHLRAPKLWLQSGSLGYLPTMVHANSPMGVEMLFTLPLAVWSDTTAKLIHFALGLLGLLAVYALGRRCRSAAVGAWAAAAFALGVPGTPFLALSTYAYIDLGLTLQVVCAALAWTRWQRTRQQGWLLCAGLCAGFAFSFKLTGLLIVFTLAALTFSESRKGIKSGGSFEPKFSAAERAFGRGHRAAAGAALAGESGTVDGQPGLSISGAGVSHAGLERGAWQSVRHVHALL